MFANMFMVWMVLCGGCSDGTIRTPPCSERGRSNLGPNEPIGSAGNVESVLDGLNAVGSVDVALYGGSSQAADAYAWSFARDGQAHLVDYTGYGWESLDCPSGEVAEIPVEITLDSAEGAVAEGEGLVRVGATGEVWLELEVQGAPTVYEDEVALASCAGAATDALAWTVIPGFDAAHTLPALEGSVEVLGSEDLGCRGRLFSFVHE